MRRRAPRHPFSILPPSQNVHPPAPALSIACNQCTANRFSILTPSLAELEVTLARKPLPMIVPLLHALDAVVLCRDIAVPSHAHCTLATRSSSDSLRCLSCASSSQFAGTFAGTATTPLVVTTETLLHNAPLNGLSARPRGASAKDVNTAAHTTPPGDPRVRKIGEGTGHVQIHLSGSVALQTTKVQPGPCHIGELHGHIRLGPRRHLLAMSEFKVLKGKGEEICGDLQQGHEPTFPQIPTNYKNQWYIYTLARDKPPN